MCTLRMAAEFHANGIAVNFLWPRTTIATRYVAGGEEVLRHSRTVDSMADAAHVILTQAAACCSGNFFIDETVLREHGVVNLDRYANTPGVALHADLFL
jgi:citronellol/citronellal dehydrogenase